MSDGTTEPEKKLEAAPAAETTVLAQLGLNLEAHELRAQKPASEQTETPAAKVPGQKGSEAPAAAKGPGASSEIPAATKKEAAGESGDKKEESGEKELEAARPKEHSSEKKEESGKKDEDLPAPAAQRRGKGAKESGKSESPEEKDDKAKSEGEEEKSEAEKGKSRSPKTKAENGSPSPSEDESDKDLGLPQVKIDNEGLVPKADDKKDPKKTARHSDNGSGSPDEQSGLESLLAPMSLLGDIGKPKEKKETKPSGSPDESGPTKTPSLLNSLLALGGDDLNAPSPKGKGEKTKNDSGAPLASLLNLPPALVGTQENRKEKQSPIPGETGERLDGKPLSKIIGERVEQIPSLVSSPHSTGGENDKDGKTLPAVVPDQVSRPLPASELLLSLSNLARGGQSGQVGDNRVLPPASPVQHLANETNFVPAKPVQVMDDSQARPFVGALGQFLQQEKKVPVADPDTSSPLRVLSEPGQNPYEAAALRDRTLAAQLQNIASRVEDPLQQLEKSLKDMLRSAPVSVENRTEEEEDKDKVEPNSALQQKNQILVQALPRAEEERAPAAEAPRQQSHISRLEAQTNTYDLEEKTSRIARIENFFQSKVQQLASVLQDLNPLRSSEPQPMRTAAIAADAAGRQAEAVLSNIVRVLDVKLLRSSDPDLAKQADPSNQQIKFAKQQILTEAMSLKDLIALSKAGGMGANPSILTDASGRVFGPAGRIDPVALSSFNQNPNVGKGVDGKIDQAIRGLKGAEPEGIKLAGKQISAFLPEEKVGERKDLIEKNRKDEKKNDDETELLELLAFNKKKNIKKTPEREEPKAEKSKKQDEEARRKYVVKEGDTLELIADKILGDHRFALLIEIINRGNLRYSWQGSLRQVHLRVGQIIWLPTSAELKVHAALYLNSKKANKGRGRSIDSCEPGDLGAQDSSWQEESSLPTVDIVDADNSGQWVSEIKSVKTAGNSGSRADAWSTGDGGESSWTVIQEFMERMRQVNSSDRLMQSRFLNSHFDNDELPAIENDDNLHLRQLNQHNRIAINYGDDEFESFTARLERFSGGTWKTVASYESRDGRSVRYLNKHGGARSAFHLNIPDHIVREMAVRDFSRNWKLYGEEYEKSDKSKLAPAAPQAAAQLAHA